MVESPVKTTLEACRWLRVDVDHRAEEDQLNALHRLVREYGLRPIGGMRPYRFLVSELERWAAAQTTAWGEHRSPSPRVNGRNGSTEADSGSDPTRSPT